MLLSSCALTLHRDDVLVDHVAKRIRPFEEFLTCDCMPTTPVAHA